MRNRSYLTSIQVTVDQKTVLDKAYELYNEKGRLRAELSGDKWKFVSKGEFLEALCRVYVFKTHPEKEI